MITMMNIKDDDKGDEQKAQRSKNISSESRTSQEFKNQGKFKTQEESLESRIKIQDLKNQDQDSRLKIQEWRKDSIKISIQKFFQNIE